MTQRWVTIVLGAAVVALAVLLAYRSAPQAGGAHGAVDAGPTDAAAASTAAAAVADADLLTAPTFSFDGGLSLGDMVALDVPMEGGAQLPDKAPRSVRFGVVLVTFQGAQGASSLARSKADALTLATKLAEDAKKDFHGAVQRGDNGSMDDAGRMPRGALEPATEYALFTLPVGSVSDPVETPRGYWIVKRLE
jgi:hypothetical protein